MACRPHCPRRAEPQAAPQRRRACSTPEENHPARLPRRHISGGRGDCAAQRAGSHHAPPPRRPRGGAVRDAKIGTHGFLRGPETVGGVAARKKRPQAPNGAISGGKAAADTQGTASAPPRVAAAPGKPALTAPHGPHSCRRRRCAAWRARSQHAHPPRCPRGGGGQPARWAKRLARAKNPATKARTRCAHKTVVTLKPDSPFNRLRGRAPNPVSGGPRYSPARTPCKAPPARGAQAAYQ